MMEGIQFEFDKKTYEVSYACILSVKFANFEVFTPTQEHSYFRLRSCIW